MPCINHHYQYQVKRLRTRKRYFNETKSPCEKFTDSPPGKMFRVQNFTVIINKLRTCLAQRKETYRGLANDFAFLKCYSDQNKKHLPARVLQLTSKYKDYLNFGCADEFEHFYYFMIRLKGKLNSPVSMLKVVKHQNLASTFLNFTIALKIFFIIGYHSV